MEYICRMGDGNRHRWRINRALMSNYATIPPLTGLRKDHKPDLQGDPEIGPKLCPLCLANNAPMHLSVIYCPRFEKDCLMKQSQLCWAHKDNYS